MSTNVEIFEATYVDPRAGNDKFYRVYVIDNRWLSQYGRNNTMGTFTKVIEAASPDAARTAATKKFASKLGKGYKPTRSGLVEANVDLSDVTVLDRVAGNLPTGGSTPSTPISEPVPTASIGSRTRDDLTDAVISALRSTTLPATAALATDVQPSLPVRPMLASVQPSQVVEDAMNSPSWVAQFKYDGDRAVIEVVDGTIRVLNRSGQAKVRNVGEAHLSPFTALHSGRWVFDGEIVGRTFVLYDVAGATDGQHTWVRDTTAFTARYRTLMVLADTLGIPLAGHDADASVVLAPVADSGEAKADFLAAAVAEQREGIMLRHGDGGYEQGRRSSRLVKHKLIKDADVVVSALHTEKQSAELSVYDGAGQLVRVGSASTIGKSAAGGGDVTVGQVWLVTFLYVTDPNNPRMYQPRLVKARNDKSATECLLSQFANAGTNRSV